MFMFKKNWYYRTTLARWRAAHLGDGIKDQVRLNNVLDIYYLMYIVTPEF